MAQDPANFTTVLQKSDSPLWSFHVVVPDHISERYIAAGSRRVVCTLFGEEEIHAALMACGEVLESAPVGKYFININQELRNRFGLSEGSEVHVSLHPDESKYGLPMPEEMAELLAQDPAGDHLFHTLTPGKQRTLLFIAGKPKRSETRLKKSTVIIEHLKATQGKLDFKLLNQNFKDANRR